MVDLTLEDRDPVVGDDDEIPTVVAGDVEVNQFVDLVVEIYRAMLPAHHGGCRRSNGSKCTRNQVAWVQAPATAIAAMTIAQITLRKSRSR
jgi:hypothetical protein